MAERISRLVRLVFLFILFFSFVFKFLFQWMVLFIVKGVEMIWNRWNWNKPIVNWNCCKCFDGELGSSVSMKRGCTQSLITTASSVGGSGVSVSSQSCSTDLCNTGDARQNFNLNNFNDFLNSINNLNAAPVLYPVYTGYPAFSLGLFPVSLLFIVKSGNQNFQTGWSFFFFSSCFSMLGNLGNFPQNNKGNYPGNLAVNYPWYGNYPSVPVPGWFIDLIESIWFDIVWLKWLTGVEIDVFFFWLFLQTKRLCWHPSITSLLQHWTTSCNNYLFMDKTMNNHL